MFFWLSGIFWLSWLAWVIAGLVRKKVVYLSAVFLVLALMFLLMGLELAVFSQLWPMLLAIPAVCSLSALIRSKIRLFHAKCITFFGTISGAWFLCTYAVMPWWGSLIITLVTLAAFITLLFVPSAKPRRKDSEKLPRKPVILSVSASFAEREHEDSEAKEKNYE